MATKELNWDITIDNVTYTVTYRKSEITVNHGYFIKIGEFKHESKNIFQANYQIPLTEDKIAILHVIPLADPVLTYENIDCNTGETYVSPSIPVWGWIIMALLVPNLFLFVGGMIGGAILGGFAWLIAGISMNNKKQTGVRVLQCIGIWFLATLVEFIVTLIIVIARQ